MSNTYTRLGGTMKLPEFDYSSDSEELLIHAQKILRNVIDQIDNDGFNKNRTIYFLETIDLLIAEAIK